jgi:hypothetical protein
MGAIPMLATKDPDPKNAAAPCHVTAGDSVSANAPTMNELVTPVLLTNSVAVVPAVP